MKFNGRFEGLSILLKSQLINSDLLESFCPNDKLYANILYIILNFIN